MSITSLDYCLHWNSFIHPYHKSLPGTHYWPDAALDTKDTTDIQTYQNPQLYPCLTFVKRLTSLKKLYSITQKDGKCYQKNKAIMEKRVYGGRM